MRYLDDILILIGVLMLGAFVYVMYGAPYVLAFAGTVLLIAGVAVAVGGRAKGGAS